PGQGQGRTLEHMVRGVFHRTDADRAHVVAGVPAGGVRHPVHGRPRPVELRDRVRFHDQRSVAHDALALSDATTGMNSSPSPSVSRLAASWTPDHTVVIHPHWG